MPDVEVWLGSDDDIGPVVIQRDDQSRDEWHAWGFNRSQTWDWFNDHFGPLIALVPTLSPGVAAIAAERAEQMGRHGWTASHDDSHTNLQLLAAAGAYLTNATTAEVRNDAATFDKYPRAVNGLPWPWREYRDPNPLAVRSELVGWRPSNDPRVALSRAGALIAAELDRLERMAAAGIPLNEDDRLAASEVAEKELQGE